MNTMKLGSMFAISLLAACFNKPSEQYACMDDTDCTGGRTCSESGYCVLPADEDGGVDMGSGDAGDPCMSFGSRHFMACSIPRPTGPMTLDVPGQYVFDTSNGTLVDMLGVSTTPPGMMVGDVRVVSVESLAISGTSSLRVRGPVPLVIAVWSTAEISGLIDVSTTSAQIGAGSLPYATPSTYCATHLSATPAQNGAGGGGGGGGAMQGNGGNGGGGNNNNDTGGSGAAGGGTTSPLLAAGCPGDKGGNGGNAGGVGGQGGGAIQITARTSIMITASGKINAGGQGGRPGTGGTGGGGGGGAGGMIGLETPSLTIQAGAILAANGGGGGQGGGNDGGTPEAGQDGQLSTTGATGGDNGSGGNGGIGGISATAAGNGINDGAGGGGGGGGAGYITIKAMSRNDTGAMFSPPATTIP